MYVYVIVESEAGPCKIGYGHNPTARALACQAGNPRKLSLCFQAPSDEPQAVERCARAMIGERNRLCGEWYAVTAEAARLSIERAIAVLAEEPAPENPGHLSPRTAALLRRVRSTRCV